MIHKATITVLTLAAIATVTVWIWSVVGHGAIGGWELRIGGVSVTYHADADMPGIVIRGGDPPWPHLGRATLGPFRYSAAPGRWWAWFPYWATLTLFGAYPALVPIRARLR